VQRPCAADVVDERVRLTIERCAADVLIPPVSNGKRVRPLKSSFSATPLEGVDGAVGVLGPVGVVGSDGESFTPPHAAMAMLHRESAVVSSFNRFDVTAVEAIVRVSATV
jgi:hypothetical protein